MDSARPAATDDLIPDLCQWRPLLVLAFIMELVAVVLTLAAGMDPHGLDRFVLTSLYLQWTGFCSAAALCLSRRWLRHAPVKVLFPVLWTLLVLVNAMIGAVSYEMLPRVDPLFFLNAEPRGSFLFRHLVIGAIVALTVLHFFWMQHQARQQLLAQGEARYQALQARIRPHFLFNSLNSIAALVAARPAEAEALVEDMAELLRASLDVRSRLAPLADELALVRAYLRIEQARLGARLRVEWDVPEASTQLDVPVLSVQPLVENAIYHGVERRAEPSLVRIAAHRRDGTLTVEVSNSRVDPATTGPARAGQQLAVDNVRQRLALTYGGAASLQLGEEGDRFVARLTVPAVKSA